MSIHDYIRLYLENKEEVEVEEARTSPPPPGEPQAGNCFILISAKPSLIHLSHKASPGPRCICHPLVFKNLSHLLAALGDRSCVLNQLLHFLPWNLIISP
jgi:hypothetical protein